jgi:hypothetical protein
MVKSKNYTYRNKIKTSISDPYQNSSSNLTGTYLFISFDLVNSTYFKSKVNSWSNIFLTFFKITERKVREKFERIEVWKRIGDEILFYLPILELRELYNAPSKVLDIMDVIVENLYEENDSVKGVLSVKSTMWTAFVVDQESETYSNQEKGSCNVLLKERNVDNIDLDFLGPDIDIGFRISKYSLQSKLVIDAKLACLLTKLETDLNKNSLSEYMRIVSYERLKGVWEYRHYPIVWYQHTWHDIDQMFWYDEKFNSEMVRKIVDSNGSSLQSVSILTKIFADLNKTSEIQQIKDGIEIYKKNNPDGFKTKKIPTDRLSEIHLVAICINPNNEILVAKRVKKDTLPEKWEFGCAQLHLNQTLQDAIKEDYKKDFGIDLEFLEDEPKIIGQYLIVKNKENNRKVPGLIFVARTNSTQLNIDTTKHSEAQWMNKEQLFAIKQDEAVPKFHKRIEDAFAYLKSIDKNM